MTISPLIRRVSIYLLLSSIAVASTNLIGANPEGAYKIYLPLFIAIILYRGGLIVDLLDHKR